MSLRAVDLFAGAGGFSTGARMAGLRVVWAANHWQTAVETHAANHPEARHSCQDLNQADWTKIPRHDVLLASPACQGHSIARGADRPHHDASRSCAWAVIACTETHLPPVVVVENVPEFARWTLFPSWVDALKRLGYGVTWAVVDAADCGVPQHRRRLFVCARRAQFSFVFSPGSRPHVPAESIIEPARYWSPVSGLCPRTKERIRNGRRAHGDRFLMAYYGAETGGRSLARPLGTITTRARHALVEGDRFRMLSVSELRAGMGFPADYQLPEVKREAIHMLGNAVPPPMARDVLLEATR